MASVGRALRAASPGLAVFAVTVAISLVMGHPADLFHTNSTRGLLTRAAFTTVILVAAIPIAPRLISLLATITGEGTPVGRLVKTSPPRERHIAPASAWFTRPLQGIGLTLLAGESLIELLESTAGLSYSEQLARLSLFVLGTCVVSLTLSTVWTMDDLGVWLYSNLGEVSSAGNTVGILLPIISGVIGITTLFHFNTPLVAAMSLVGIIAAMYPPYLVFAIAHDEYTTGRLRTLHASLPLRTLRSELT
jgi:hypothetical protein